MSKDIWEDLIQIRLDALQMVEMEGHAYLSDHLAKIEKECDITIVHYRFSDECSLQVYFSVNPGRDKEEVKTIFTEQLQLDGYDYFELNADGTGEFSYTPHY